MSIPGTTARAEIEAQITTLLAQLTAANAAYTAALTSADIQSYSFDSGEGKQATTRRKPSEIRTEIDHINRELTRLRQRLNGRGISNMNLRR